MSALLDFPSHLLGALPSAEPGTSTTESPLVRRRWNCRYEAFAEYLQWSYNVNINILPSELKVKFENTIAATREHELAIAVIVANNQVPETRFVVRGYLHAFRVLMHFLKDQALDGVALDKRFNLRVAREMLKRLELARDPGVDRHYQDLRQRRSGRSRSTPGARGIDVLRGNYRAGSWLELNQRARRRQTTTLRITFGRASPRPNFRNCYSRLEIWASLNRRHGHLEMILMVGDEEKYLQFAFSLHLCTPSPPQHNRHRMAVTNVKPACLVCNTVQWRKNHVNWIPGVIITDSLIEVEFSPSSYRSWYDTRAPTQWFFINIQERERGLANGGYFLAILGVGKS
ncbi:hypothetical protein B0J17DRAFT_744219 [Rhizoctonia solani]|nr:hypothetical protein B0J17DRAFT_744219 [Rhizoctonia solani]